jgi:signal transduction histidine kinase
MRWLMAAYLWRKLMTRADPNIPIAPESRWRLLLRLRWPLAMVISLAFALGQLIEALLIDRSDAMLDILLWGLLGGIAVWSSLTWASRRERSYQANMEQALHEQQDLNRRLQRANTHLALLSEVNRRIADSATLDEILDGALAFPQRLVPAGAAALLLYGHTDTIATRVERLSASELAQLQAAFGLNDVPGEQLHPYLLAPAGSSRTFDACLVLPLHDGMALVGRIELYLTQPVELAEDELALLETIASELAEAIVSARRRSREERAIYELERAITEERSRIARDIHDGLAQTLAFRRMRVDLWLDWIESDQPRLRAELIGLKDSLREQIVELRRAIFALRPVQFDDLGFIGGLHRYINEFAGQQGWEARIDMSQVPLALTPELEALCFRIIQEALTNVAKHANAAHVEVTVDQVDSGLRVVVRDDGRGFEPGNVPAGTLGLRQMRERLGALRGQLTLLSQPGAGTELRAWIPLPSEQVSG